MQVAYLLQQQARRLKAGEGRVAEGVNFYSLTGTVGAVETRLFEIEPDGRLASSGGGGERHYFVLQGVGTVGPASGKTTQEIKTGAMISLSEDEGFSIANSGEKSLMLLYIAPATTRPATQPAAAPAQPANQRGTGEVSRPASNQPARGEGNRPTNVTPIRQQPPPEPELEDEDNAADAANDAPHYRLVFSADGSRNGGSGSFAVFPPVAAGRKPTKPVVERNDYPDASSQPEAEYQTLLDALDGIAEVMLADEHDPSECFVDIVTDSKVVVAQMRDGAAPKSEALTNLRDSVMDSLASFAGYSVGVQSRDASLKVLGVAEAEE